MDKKKRPLQILTIDDETQIQFALKAVFQSQGWEMISAKDAEEGIEKCRAFRPDLVLIDYHLPKVNGIKVVERLHKEDPNVPLIVFTIEDNQEVANQFLAAGASDFILKPVKALDLADWGKLTFFRPDYDTFVCIGACREAIARGGLYPAAVNAANEQAVSLFRQEKIGFLDIGTLVCSALEHALPGTGGKGETLEEILAADEESRRYTMEAAQQLTR